MKLFVKSLSVLVAGVAMAGWFSAQAGDTAAAKNTAPVSQTCLQGQPCAAAATASEGGGAKTGEQVYNTACNSCHATGAAGAPKVGDAAAWQARVAARNKDGLYKSAVSGFNGMPAKGLCFSCSDDELKGAVDYMLGKSK